MSINATIVAAASDNNLLKPRLSKKSLAQTLESRWIELAQQSHQPSPIVAMLCVWGRRTKLNINRENIGRKGTAPALRGINLSGFAFAALNFRYQRSQLSRRQHKDRTPFFCQCPHAAPRAVD